MSDIFRDWSFGGILKTYRIRKGYTLREICKKLETDVGNYCKVESSRISPPNSSKKLEKIKEVLELDEIEFNFLECAALNHHIGAVKSRFKNK